ncbi:TlpA family protein disulfide reductase, partial [Rhodopirellula sp. JC639]|uniref:TlpA family protein disulfide reductase n=1 Tax=Stieleria mannarensis TaxID=2755585 RepID=UPI0015FEEC44
MKSLLVFLSIVIPFSACFSQDANPDASQERANIDPKSRFIELATRYNTLQEQYYAYEPKEGEDGIKRFLENHPMNAMVSDFIALEQQSRGAEVGFSCLYHLVLAAASVGDADYPVTAGKIAALKVLAEHYHDYPDVDTTFRYLFSGARVPESKIFLRNLIASSRHGYVRANAMYELANYLALEANLPAMCESQLAVMDRADPENEARMKHFETFTANLKDVAVERNRAEALSLIERIGSEYQNELAPPRVGVRNPGIISVTRSEIDEVLKSKRERIVDRLPAIQFELNHSIGQTAPLIDGKDARGEPMSLADYHGKIVVLMFSFKGCGPCEAMYPDNRKLIEEMSEEQFVFVGVQGDETIDTVHESLESKAITWRVWWDGADKRISTQWNIRGWPSTFVLDQRGVIRYRDLRGKELSNAVRSLLKKETE